MTLRLGIVDANTNAAKEYKGVVASVIGQWLEWEASRVGVQLTSPGEADVVLVVFAGSVGWDQAARRELKRVGIRPCAVMRTREDDPPFVLTGGPVDATPLTALAVADGVLIGEGYRFVRLLLDVILDPRATKGDVERLVVEDPHAIARSQVVKLKRDRERKWLLAEPPEILATPDPWVDWTVPAVKTDDKVVRVLGSKGCHFKCGYCATTFRQAKTENPSPGRVRSLVKRLGRAGERVQVLSNDPANIKWYPALQGHLDHGSYTIEEFLRPENRAAIIRQRPRIVRFGVEGLSERLRHSWMKPIPHATVLDVLADLERAKINSHMFMIVGAPFEGEVDWMEWRDFMVRLVAQKEYGITRIKFTSYQPSPPAPLVRFVSGNDFEGHYDRFRDWYIRNSVSSHILLINPRRAKTRTRDVAEQLQVSREVAAKLVCTPGTKDLAPTPEDFARMPSNLIGWPIASDRRFKISETFRGRVHSAEPLPPVATVARTLGTRGVDGARGKRGRSVLADRA